MNLKFIDASPRVKNIARFLIGLPLTVISFFFIGRFVFESGTNMPGVIARVNIPALLAGFLCLVAFFIIKAAVWHLILKKNKYSIPFARSLFIYSYSEVRRYIPGNIFSFISRANLLKEYDIPVKRSIRLMVIEVYILVISAAISSIPVAFFIKEPIMRQAAIWVRPFFPVTFLLVILSAIFYKQLVNIAKNVLLFCLRYFEIVIVASFGWFLFGLGNFFIAESIKYINPYYFFQYLSLFVAAWLVGYLSIVAPMGLGVREGAITAGLANFAGIELTISAFISVFGRLVFIAAELTNLLFLYISLNFVKSLKPIYSRISISWIFLTAFIGFYGIYFTYVSFQKYENFFSGRFDLGNMDQTVWNTLYGRIFMLTNPDNINIISRLATHADFILILLAPLYLLWEDPRMLLLIQTIVISLGAVFVYLLSRQILKSRSFGTILAGSYLLNPWVQRQNLYDFHAVALATTFLLATFYFLNRKSYILFFLFLALSVITKENVFLIAAFLGIYIAMKGKWKTGIPLSIISGTAFYLLVAKFIPQARGGAHFALSYFTDFGDSPASIMASIFLNPSLTFAKVFNFERLFYLTQLFIPTGFLSLLSPIYIILSLPELGINLLSSNSNLRSINFHYGALIVPFVYLSTIYSLKFLLRYNYMYLKKFIQFYLIFFALLSSWLYGVLPGSRNPSLEVFANTLPKRAAIAKFIDTIPGKYSVAATNNLGAHLSHRERIYTIPNGIDQADIVLFLLNDQFAQPSLAEQQRMVERLKKDRNYVILYDDYPFVVFAKNKVIPPNLNF